MIEKTAAVAISLIPGLNCRNRIKLMKNHATVKSVSSINPDYLEFRFKKRSRKFIIAQILEKAASIVDLCRKDGIDIIPIRTENYPDILENIYDPPPVLYCRGRVPGRDFAAVGIVGTRKADEAALTQSFQIALDFAFRECPVVSGLALGIDGAAHRGALAGSGWNIAVLASGVDMIYPVQHRITAREMLMNGGTLLSEYPPGTEPAKYRYPQRNRIISGLCQMTVIIQAPQKSGALITADYALQEGRDIFVADSGLNAEGTRRLAESGADIIKRGTDILSMIGIDVDNEPGEKIETPLNHKEMIERIKLEMNGDLVRYGGAFFHGV